MKRKLSVVIALCLVLTMCSSVFVSARTYKSGLDGIKLYSAGKTSRSVNLKLIWGKKAKVQVKVRHVPNSKKWKTYTVKNAKSFTKTFGMGKKRSCVEMKARCYDPKQHRYGPWSVTKRYWIPARLNNKST